MQFLDTGAAFGLNLAQFSDKLYEQMSDALKENGLSVHARATGILQQLYSEGPCSQADIATRLRTSHQLISQRLSSLKKQDFIEFQSDPEDGRRKLIKLTPSGEAEGKKLQDFLPRLMEAYRDLFAEIDVDLRDVVMRAEDALNDRSLFQRMSRGDGQ